MGEGLQTAAEWQLNVTREINVPKSAIQIIDVNVVASGSALSFAPARSPSTALAKVSHESSTYFMFKQPQMEST
jgi:hypothetical protein